MLSLYENIKLQFCDCRTLPLIRFIKPPMLDNYQYQVLMSMNSAICTKFVVRQSFTNEKSSGESPTNDEENQFDIEEIDV